jgi:hypothetical protein
MYDNKSILSGVFRESTGFHPVAQNDNATLPSIFFSMSEVQQLNDVVMPYLRSGVITEAGFKKGYESGVFLVKDDRQRDDVVFCVAIHRPGDAVADYAISGAHVKSCETINFSQVMKIARHVMASAYPDALLQQQQRLSLV